MPHTPVIRLAPPVGDAAHRRIELTLSGRLYAESVDALRAQLATVDASGVRTLIIDATELEQIDALALRALLEALRTLRRREGSMVIVGLRPYIHRTFELVGLDRLVTLVADRDTAGRLVATPGT